MGQELEKLAPDGWRRDQLRQAAVDLVCALNPYLGRYGEKQPIFPPISLIFVALEGGVRWFV
jgi:hypothetical protein